MKSNLPKNASTFCKDEFGKLIIIPFKPPYLMVTTRALIDWLKLTLAITLSQFWTNIIQEDMKIKLKLIPSRLIFWKYIKNLKDDIVANLSDLDPKWSQLWLKDKIKQCKF